MFRRLTVLMGLSLFLVTAPPIAGQDTGDSTPRPKQSSSATPTPQSTDASQQSPAAAEQGPSNQPQIIVNPTPAPPPEWGWRQQVTWGATIVLAVLGYVGIMLALRTLKSIDQHLMAGTSTTQAAMDSANAALALAQAIASSERPWIVVTVEPFLTMENSFKVMASNRGRSPARIVSSVDQVKIAADEKNLPDTPEFEKVEAGDEPEPIVLLPGEATGIWALNRGDLSTICKTPEVLKRVERWQDTLFLYGRIQYMELTAVGDKQMHETFWCCRYIHGEKSSALVMAGSPIYNKHT
ncbi:MAG TPA: hypothetical protein VHW46_12240 [Terracidiphilus sp.]|jgi:hypothetical protein|nr:hypothetical protein [Terracidiphilus sp.]